MMLKHKNTASNAKFSFCSLDNLILLICGLIFITLSIIQVAVKPVTAGIIAQLQVLISLYLTVKFSRKGYRYGIILNLLISLAAAYSLLIERNNYAGAGIAVPLVTILIITIIFRMLKKTRLNHIQILKQGREIIAAKNEADRASKAKSEFLSSMSHEIRTPFNNIMGYLELISLGKLDNIQREYFSIIEKSSLNLLSIINDILDFAKIENKKIELHKTLFDPAENTADILKLFSIECLKNGILLNFSNDSPPFCLGDSVRFNQIVTNLISNAVKFTPPGGEINVTMKSSVSSAKLTLEVSVQDTGIGIDKENQKTIFNAFVQAGSSVSTRLKGTGLGLSITSNLVKLMGGTISVESSPDKGSCFTFFVILDIPGDEQFFSPKHKKPGLIFTPKSISHVLIAEDTPESRELLNLMLKILHITCDQAENGQEALNLFLKNKYDAVFLDGCMPVMDGIETLKKIREHEKETGSGRIPIIALSARAITTEQSEFIDAGADFFLSKPVSIESISETITAAEDNKSSFRPISASGRDDGSHDFFSDLSEHLGIAKEKVIEIYNEFIKKGLPDYLLAIDKSLIPFDSVALYKAAHRLRGASASLNLRKLNSACTVLEEHAKNHDAGKCIDSAKEIHIAARSAAVNPKN